MQDNAVQNLWDDSSRTVIKLHHDRLALISVTDAQHRAILKYQRSATGLADNKVAKLELKLKELAVAWQWWDLMGFHFRIFSVSDGLIAHEVRVHFRESIAVLPARWLRQKLGLPDASQSYR